MVYEILMEMVFEKITAITSSMTIVYSQKLRANTILLNIEGYTDAIFIIVSANSAVSVDSVGFYKAILFA